MVWKLQKKGGSKSKEKGDEKKRKRWLTFFFFLEGSFSRGEGAVEFASGVVVKREKREPLLRE